MNLIQRIKAAFIPSQGSDAGNKYNQSLFSYFNGIFFNIPNNPRAYVRSGYQGNPDVFAIINMIAKKAASVPFYVYEIDNKKSFNRTKNNPINLLKKGLTEVEGTDLNRLIARPNEMQSQQEYIESLVSFLEITGNAYSYKFMPEVGRNKGVPTKLYPLPSQFTQIIGSGTFEPISAYKLQIGNQEIEFKVNEVNHIKFFNPDYNVSGNQLYGMSPLMAAWETVSSSNEGTRAKAKAFINGGAAGLLFSGDKDAMLDGEQISKINQQIDTKLTGADNYKRIVATNGIVDYKQIGMSPADLEIIKSIGADRDTLCRVFGVDPILMATDSASYNNKEMAYKGLVTNTVIPILNMIRGMFNEVALYYSLRDGVEYYIDYDVQAFPEMQKDMEKIVTQMKESWWITPNEKRDAMNYDRIEESDMDRILVPANLTYLDELGMSDQAL
jgi:HK97 family phage portal protein